MYTWGYIKESTLSKLNLGEEEANQLGFLSRFPYYANEAMTQICSAIKPKEVALEIIVDDENIDTVITFPDEFIAFDDDAAEVKFEGCDKFVEAYDDVLQYVGYNQVICKRKGVYHVPYKARWFFFTKELHNADVVTAPADICDALPLYIVSQCYKIDDEKKAAIYRNEYEIFLARIDDTSFKTQRTLKVGGGW
jgi:hypothetical protein